MTACLAVSTLFWLVRYATKFGWHLYRPPQWIHSFDQSRYITSALAFAHGDLDAARHWYPLAYPLLAAPFSWLMPDEPFFLPNLLLFLATIVGFARVMRRIGIGPVASTAVWLFATMLIGKTSRLWTEPWTTTLSAPLIWFLIAKALAIMEPAPDRAPPAPRAFLLLGLIGGALPLVRPGDGLMTILACLFVLAALSRQRRLRPAGLLWLVLGGLTLTVPYGLLHLAIYGPHASDYARFAAAQGFAFADLPWKAYVVLITAAPWYPGSPSLAEALPWIIPGAAGILLAWRDGDAGTRRAIALVLLLAIPYSVLFLAYTDLQPPGVWTFSNAHYFKWIFPFLGMGFWLWLRAFRDRRGAVRAVVALVVVLLPALIRPLPVALPETVPARMLMFRGGHDRFWDTAYFAPATITDAQGSMINVGRFHQVPDPYGERALAVSRLFSGPATRDDAGEPAPFRSAQRPYARYAVTLSFGLPCWFRRLGACRIAPPPGEGFPVLNPDRPSASAIRPRS
jgi:hypothetical protein